MKSGEGLKTAFTILKNQPKRVKSISMSYLYKGGNREKRFVSGLFMSGLKGGKR